MKQNRIIAISLLAATTAIFTSIGWWRIMHYRSRTVTPIVYEPDYFTPHSVRVVDTSQSTPSATLWKVPILMYHYVEYAPASDPMRQKLSINPREFERQLKGIVDAKATPFFVKEIPLLLASASARPVRPVVLTFDDGYRDFYTDAYPLLKKYKIKSTLYMISGYIGRNDFLTQKQLREIAASGLVEIGSHTVSHISLAKATPAQSRLQIFESKRALETQIGTPVATFAYPFGAYTSQSALLVKEASYSAAVSTRNGWQQTASDLFALYRVRAGALYGRSVAATLEHWWK